MKEKSVLEKLAYEIAELLEKHECHTDVAIYFEGKRLSTFADLKENYRKWVLEEGYDPKSYTEYANPKTITMTFEGSFYEVMNYGFSPKLYDKFTQLINSYGFWFELGNAWNLSLYSDDPQYQEEKEIITEPIIIYGHTPDVEIPDEINKVRYFWKEKQNEYGDSGSCVLGAGFEFEYQNNKYRMLPQGKWQGSCSWEASKDEVGEMLKEIGCTNVIYRWGVMD